MDMKKLLFGGIMATAVMAFTAFCPAYVSAAAGNGDTAVAAQAPAAKEDGKKKLVINLGYKYTSPRYGYTIMCPTKPDVLPASMLNEEDKGDVLIFRSSGKDIKKAWVIIVNGYSDEVLPPNLATMTEDEKKALIKKFIDQYGFEFAKIAEIGDDRLGMYCVTAKDVMVDTDGDGKVDTPAHSDTQMVKVFMPGQYGAHYMVGLISNPTITTENLVEFEAGAVTLQQWPKSAYDSAKAQAVANRKNNKKYNK